jgi:hypothetical protein
MSCVETRRLTPRLVGLDLPGDQEQAVREHLTGCGGCRRELMLREPALAMALLLAGGPVSDTDDFFVSDVMSSVRQRQLERRLTGRRRRWLAVAAAALLALLGGTTALRHQWRPGTVVAASARTTVSEPAFVEVDGPDVRLYQLTSASREAVQVAFVVDPHLEL